MWSKAVRKTVSHLTLKNFQRWGMILIIPLVATIIVARQLILQHTQDLSAWNGGGMGMFAETKSATRYAKVYILTPEGDRHPIVGLTRFQDKLLTKLKNYPIAKNFLPLAENITRTEWVASRRKFTYRIIDKTGNLISEQPRKHLYLRAGSPSPPDKKIDWKVQIEFWKGRYDHVNNLVRVKVAKTFTFPEE